VEWQDQKGSREKRGHKENEDRRDLLVIQVHRVVGDTKVLQVLLVSLVHKEIRAHLVLKVHLGLPVPRVLLEPRESLD
jgi:hypothetical protein